MIKQVFALVERDGLIRVMKCTQYFLRYFYPFQNFPGLNRQGPSPKANAALIQQCSVAKDKKSGWGGGVEEKRNLY